MPLALPFSREQGRFLVIGCGHTGTTLVAGILHINGYGSFRVSRLFENVELNYLNRRILSSDVGADAIRRFVNKVERRTGGRWSLKDPLLSETAPLIYPHVPKPVKIIFNYREPGSTVQSLLREREIHEPLRTPAERLRSAENEYLNRNRAALAFIDSVRNLPTLMLHYDELVDGHLDIVLCTFVGRSLDLSFASPHKRHSQPLEVRQELHDLYEELNERCRENQQTVLRTLPTLRPLSTSRPTIRTRFHVGSNRVANATRHRLDRVGALLDPRKTWTTRND